MTAAEADGIATGTGPADLHALLLGMAGRVPDEELADMRLSLADHEDDRLGALLAAEVEAGRLALTGAEAALIRGLGPECDPGTEHLPAPPYRFGDRHGVATLGGDGVSGRRDAMDAVAVEAGRRVGGPIGIWRVFRHSGDGHARRVYLIEAEAGTDVAELTAETQYALAEASEDTPRVEAFAAGALLPAYHGAALGGATLIWAADDAPARLARAFDGADPAGGPYFRDDHPRLGGPDRERVLAYLHRGEPVLTRAGGLDDVLDPGRPGAVPAGFRSDGRWIWPEAVAYYLSRYDLAPEPDLTAYVLDREAPYPPLTRLTRHRVLTTLFAPTGGEPVWQAG